MTISVEKHYKLHLFIFAFLSIHLFILIPFAFVSKFLTIAACLGILFYLKNIRFVFRKWYEIVIFAAVNAYLTLAIFGYNLFFDYSSNSSNMGIVMNCFYFGLGFIWTSYLLQSLLGVIESLNDIKNRFVSPSNDRYWKKWLTLFSIMFVLFMLWQRAFNPIVLSPDSWGYIGGWRTGTYDSFRSPVYSFLIYIVCSLAPTKPEVQWIAFAQNFAFSSLLATILMYFHKKWIKFIFVVPVAFILPLIPSLGLHTIVVWCDLACGMSMLWLTYVLVRILDEVIINNTANRQQQRSFYVQLCVSMVLIYFIRSNSFLVYLIMAPVLSLLFILKKKWKLLASVAASVVMALLIQFPGYTALNVHSDMREQAMYYAAIHDIQATYYGGGDFSEQTIASLRKHVTKLDDPDAKDTFRPGVVLYSYYAYDMSDLTMSKFVSMYTDSFIHNPIKMIKSMLLRVRAYWVIDAKDSISYIGYTDIYDRYNSDEPFLHNQAPEIGVYRQSNFLTGIMDKYVLVTSLSIPAMFIWRFGVWTALMTVSILSLLLQKRYIWMVAYIPVFVYLVTLYLSSGWTDYRYGIPVFFIGLFLPLALILLNPTDAKTPAFNKQ